MASEVQLKDIDALVAAHGTGRDATIPLLHAVQERYHYLPEAALRRITEITQITPANLHSVATFFPQFRLKPAGKHRICVCDGTACHLKGSMDIYAAIAGELGLAKGEDTDADGTFTLQAVRCLGCCTLAPAVQIDTITYGHLRKETVPNMLADFLSQAESTRIAPARISAADSEEREIRIGLGSCCVAGGSDQIRIALEETLARFDLSVRIKPVSCVGMCHQTPLMEIIDGGISRIYAKVRPEDVPAIVLHHFPPGNPLRRIRARATQWLDQLYNDASRETPEQRSMDPKSRPVTGFLSVQKRIATEHSGMLNPTDLDEYIKTGGFTAFYRCMKGVHPKAVERSAIPLFANAPEAPADAPFPDQNHILDLLEESGLRGRGGAGFPTHRKWRIVREAPGEKKYIICNGDEGDPGAFMDRMILESFAYRVIEGMLIASLAVGAHHGIFYIRSEYPLAVARMRSAIRKCEEAGLLGDAVFGSSHSFHAEVREGAGAFVCGEETALIASLEGDRPTPRFRPPFPAQSGLHGRPTLVNNVETLSMIPWIFRRGAAPFAALGTDRSKGTKVFALAGKIRRGGLIEVPMGLTLRKIIEEIGGGVAEGRTLKAVQVGGPSGGCIPAAMADLPVDYEALSGAGSMMGSGGLVVMDDTDCMVEMTRYFLSFTQLESCGKCTPCRIGTRQMLEILTRICEGRGQKEDLDHLESLASEIRTQSLCGLGKTAPNPVITGLRHFREEFEAHIAGKCPAKKCKDLIGFSVTDACIGCTKCAQACPADAIAMKPYEIHEINREACTRCGACLPVCPVHAIEVH